MAKTIQIRLKEEDYWMKDTIQGLQTSGDKTYQNRSESDIAKMFLADALKKFKGGKKTKGRKKSARAGIGS